MHKRYFLRSYFKNKVFKKYFEDLFESWFRRLSEVEIFQIAKRWKQDDENVYVCEHCEGTGWVNYNNEDKKND